MRPRHFCRGEQSLLEGLRDKESRVPLRGLMEKGHDNDSDSSEKSGDTLRKYTMSRNYGLSSAAGKRGSHRSARAAMLQQERILAI